ncbi:MAG: dihydropteroate synthase [Candidatus Methanomethylophilaceae archaeon]|nr:dihydropteroate synthase [Candidatus Methanomethylophilaceae archaeon]
MRWRFTEGKVQVMGVLNVTPDSFSDGGRWTSPDTAVAHALEMEDSGADVIDIGAESTRPFSEPVSAETEISRLKPVLRDLIPSLGVPVSVDTMKTEVAQVALDMGADIVNDVNGLRAEGMMELCAGCGAAVVIMHMHGRPSTLRTDVMGDGFKEEIVGFLRSRSEDAMEAGIGRDRIILDPGIGFGKTHEQSAEIMRSCGDFSLGFPVLAGISRKGFLSYVYPGLDRDSATADATVEAVRSGASMVRVHDVATAVAALKREGLPQE